MNEQNEKTLSKLHQLAGLSKEELIKRLRQAENIIMTAIRCGDWERGEAATALQAVGYVLLDEELYPDEDDVWPPDEENIPEDLQFKFEEGSWDDDDDDWKVDLIAVPEEDEDDEEDE